MGPLGTGETKPSMPKLYCSLLLYRRHQHVQFAGLASTGTFCRERAATGIECRFESGYDDCDRRVKSNHDREQTNSFPIPGSDGRPGLTERVEWGQDLWFAAIFRISHQDSELRRGLAPCELNSHRVVSAPRREWRSGKSIAGVAEWQTRRIQNPVWVIPCAGSTPASGTLKTQQKH
jgi:hypothetical protein